MSSDNSALVISRSLSISSKIQNKMEKIIIIIKAMGALNKEEELAKLNRLLYRAMDNLTEFELELLQLQVRCPICTGNILECYCDVSWFTIYHR